jgi:hypothetical protein
MRGNHSSASIDRTALRGHQRRQRRVIDIAARVSTPFELTACAGEPGSSDPAGCERRARIMHNALQRFRPAAARIRRQRSSAPLLIPGGPVRRLAV